MAIKNEAEGFSFFSGFAHVINATTPFLLPRQVIAPDLQANTFVVNIDVNEIEQKNQRTLQGGWHQDRVGGRSRGGGRQDKTEERRERRGHKR
jgi:hypothetical protein